MDRNNEAFHGIIANYAAILPCFTYAAEGNHIDDYETLAEGVFHQMNQFKSLFEVKLSYLIFSATDQTPKCLQNSFSFEASRQDIKIAISYPNIRLIF